MKCDHCANPATLQETNIQGGKVVQRNLCEQCAKALGIRMKGPEQLAQALSQAVMSQAMAGAMKDAAGRPRAGSAACPTCGLTYAQFRQNSMLGCAGCYAAFEAQLGPLLERVHEGATHHVGKRPKRIVDLPVPPTPPSPPSTPPPSTPAAPAAANAAPEAIAPPKPPTADAAPATPSPKATPGASPPRARPLRAGKVPPTAPAGTAAPGSPPTDPAALTKHLALLRRQLNEAVAAEQYERAAQIRDQIRRTEGEGPAGGA